MPNPSRAEGERRWILFADREGEVEVEGPGLTLDDDEGEGMAVEVVPASALLAAQQSLEEIEGYLSAEMGDGQLPPRVKDRIDRAYAAARVALGKNPSP